MIDTLIEKIKEKGNPTVAGLDPKLAYLPEEMKKKAFDQYGETFEGAANAIFEFNKELIDALYDIVPAVKPQSAYYEMYGIEGIKCLKKYSTSGILRESRSSSILFFALENSLLPLRSSSKHLT